MNSMIAALSLHIAFVLLWTGALVFMPVLFMQQARSADAERREGLQLMQRWLYAKVMTPSALLAVTAGTWLVFERSFVGGWLHVKLPLVLLLTWFHVHCGHLMVRLKREGPRHGPLYYGLMPLVPVALIATILWLVTGKPF